MRDEILTKVISILSSLTNYGVDDISQTDTIEGDLDMSWETRIYFAQDIENTFGILVSDDDLLSPDFISVDTVVGFIMRKQEGKNV